MMRSICKEKNLKGKRILVRTSLNVPLRNGVVHNDSRLQKALATITYLRDHEAKVILISHLSGDATNSLCPVYDYLAKQVSLTFVEDILSDEAKDALATMHNGDIILAENIRRFPEEKENTEAFAEKLASLADIYVNDDFTAAHRSHASIVGVPKFLPSYMGLQFEREVYNLSKAFSAPTPSLLILGGAKPETKIPLATQFLSKMTTVFVGGVSANVLFQAKGLCIGKSLHTDKKVNVDKALNASNVVLPTDVRIQTAEGEERVVIPQEVTDTDTIYDAGPASVAELSAYIQKARFVLWNGPLGDYEKGFDESTIAIAKALAESDAQSIVGGGDTSASIAELGLEDKFTFLSTAGGAMLDFLADGTLPGIQALEK